MNRSFVSPPGVIFCSSEAMARIEACSPGHVEEESPAWHSALQSIELSLGLGDIRDCFHRYVLDDEFASYFGVDTVSASSLSLAPTWKGACWKNSLRWTFCGVASQWGSRGVFTLCRRPTKVSCQEATKSLDLAS